MSRLPPGWRTIPIGEVCKVVGGSTPKTSVEEYWGGDIPWITPSDLSGHLGKYISRGERSITRSGYESCSTTLMPTGSVLFSSRAPIGYVAIAANPSCTNQGFKSFVPSDAVRSDYLYWYLRFAAPSIRRMGSGTTFSEISGKIAKTIPLVLAPQDEQQRIVEAIEEQFSRLDAGVESLQRAKRNLGRMRSSVLKSAVEGKLVPRDSAEGSGHELVASMVESRRQRWREDQPAKSYKEPQEPSQLSHDAPEYWGVASLESLTDPMRVICYGILKPKTDGELTVPYVEVRDIRDGRIDVAGLNRTTQELHSQFPRSHLKAGDVLIAVRGSYDRSAVVPSELTDANISRDVARLAPLEGLISEFLALYLHSPPVLAHFRRIARGVAVKGINISSIRELTIRVPPVAEQSRIVAEVDRQLSIVDALTETVVSGLLHATQLRHAILADAFSGRLVPSSRRAA